MKGLWRRVFAFIAGFTAVYVFLGISVAFVGSFFRVHMNWLFGIAGLILIVFGLHVARVFRIPFLEGKFGGIDKADDPRDLIGAFMVGVAFAIGWSPCTGPILAAILTLAANQEKVWSGGLLLVFFCVGLGLPFLLTGLAVRFFLGVFDRIQRHMRKVEIVSAVLLIIVGLLFITQNMNFIRGWVGFDTMGLESYFKGSIIGGVSLLALFAAFLAGFLSFISPCVLPLLPSYIAFIAGTYDLDSIMGEGEGS